MHNSPVSVHSSHTQHLPTAAGNGPKVFLYLAYFAIVVMIFFDGTAVFDGAFAFLGVPTGSRTFVIQAIGGVLVTMMLLGHGMSGKMRRDLTKLLLLWAPWLIYLYLRSDMTDPYTAKKLARIFALQFVSLIYIVIAFHASPRCFQRYFFPVVFLMSALLLIMFALSPSLFYRTAAQRLTLENVSPVWLARTFAIAALWMFLLIRFPLWVRVVSLLMFTAGILATGSRGPLLALYGVLGFAVFVKHSRKRHFALKALLGSTLAGLLIVVSIPALQDPLNNYFSRGHSKPIFEQSGRKQLWQQAATDIISAPGIGVGLGKYNKQQRTGIVDISRAQFDKKRFVRTYPHNVVLEILAELGVIGLLLFLGTLRPGRWMTDFEGPYAYLFWLSLLFAMTSGDLPANSGLFMFGLIAMLVHRDRISLMHRR